jgi:hypothetical protein
MLAASVNNNNSDASCCYRSPYRRCSSCRLPRPRAAQPRAQIGYNNPEGERRLYFERVNQPPSDGQEWPHRNLAEELAFKAGKGQWQSSQGALKWSECKRRGLDELKWYHYTRVERGDGYPSSIFRVDRRALHKI